MQSINWESMTTSLHVETLFSVFVLIGVGVSTTWVLELKNTAGFLHGTCVLCSSLHVDETSQRLGRSSLSCALVEFPSVESKQKPPGALSEVTGSPARPAISNKREKGQMENGRIWQHTKTHIKGPYTPGQISTRVIHQRFSTRFFCSHPSDFR